MKTRILFYVILALVFTTQGLRSQYKSDYPLLSYARQSIRIGNDSKFIFRLYYELPQSIKGQNPLQQADVEYEIKRDENEIRELNNFISSKEHSLAEIEEAKNKIKELTALLETSEQRLRIQNEYKKKFEWRNIDKRMNKKAFMNTLDSLRNSLSGKFLSYKETAKLARSKNLFSAEYFELLDYLDELEDSEPDKSKINTRANWPSILSSGEDYSTYILDSNPSLVTIKKTNDGVRWEFYFKDDLKTQVDISHISQTGWVYGRILDKLSLQTEEEISTYFTLFNLLIEDQQSNPKIGLYDLMLSCFEDEDGVSFKPQRYKKYIPYMKDILAHYKRVDVERTKVVPIYNDGKCTYFVDFNNANIGKRIDYAVVVNNETKNNYAITTQDYVNRRESGKAFIDFLLDTGVAVHKFKSEYLKERANYYKSLGITPVKVIYW
jgi:hypothetical protein